MKFIEQFILGIFEFCEHMAAQTPPYKRLYSKDEFERKLRYMGIPVAQGFRNLSCRGLVQYSADQSSFKFTRQGAIWWKKRSRQYFKLRYPKWDGKWRLVLFDIPSEFNYQRAKFRRRIKGLGCFMVQKSVFIFPYPCEEEIGDISRDLQISKYIDIILAENPGYKEKEIKKFFDL